MRRLMVAAALVSTFGCQDTGEALAKNVGLNACNGLNGAYRGTILNVLKDPVNHSGIWVYRVQAKGSRATYAPADNTTVVTGKCPDGQP